MKTTVIYLRVSNLNGQKFDSQKMDLKKWVVDNRINGFLHKIFIHCYFKPVIFALDINNRDY